MWTKDSATGCITVQMERKRCGGFLIFVCVNIFLRKRNLPPLSLQLNKCFEKFSNCKYSSQVQVTVLKTFKWEQYKRKESTQWQSINSDCSTCSFSGHQKMPTLSSLSINNLVHTTGTSRHKFQYSSTSERHTIKTQTNLLKMLTPYTKDADKFLFVPT